MTKIINIITDKASYWPTRALADVFHQDKKSIMRICADKDFNTITMSCKVGDIKKLSNALDTLNRNGFYTKIEA